jgi:ABC-type Fe3+/spermidine/putrescine transport system ATPase subunit
LLDEPLSNLDPSLREDLRDQIREVIHQLKVTTVFVTHDQQEALALSDRVAVMEAGMLHQVGGPEEIYCKPINAFVARFLGKANLLPIINGGMIFVRPEDVIIQDESAVTHRAWQATVTKIVFEGAIVTYTLDTEGATITARQFHHGKSVFQTGQRVRVRFPDDQSRIIPFA